MALRISLIVAILAGLGVISVSQFVLRPQIEEIIATRDGNKKGWDQANEKLAKTQTELKQTNTKLAATTKNLDETKAQLSASTAKAESEEKRANGLQKDLTATRGTLKTAQDKLEQWRQIGLEPEGVKGLLASEKKLQGQVAAVGAENTLLSKKVKVLSEELKSIRNIEEEVYVPREARGKVKVVDPKWDFVILDVGSSKGLPDRGLLLVSRNGELVAKVRVTSVQDDRSIANVLPGWKIKDILEGDAVFPY